MGLPAPPARGRAPQVPSNTQAEGSPAPPIRSNAPTEEGRVTTEGSTRTPARRHGSPKRGDCSASAGGPTTRRGEQGAAHHISPDGRRGSGQARRYGVDGDSDGGRSAWQWDDRDGAAGVDSQDRDRS